MLIVEQVPCLECDFCAEQYFDIQALKKIEADHLFGVFYAKLKSPYSLESCCFK